ncbi:rhodanese-like domain-containing protein [Candidatus Gracilibacteria bacterium]|nr:rhodanese-like domain-containing protein [Candidatus Gracilibacteria bacterium]
MSVFDLFTKDACDIRGKTSTDKRTRTEYFTNKKELESQGIKVVLVDMINHPIEDSVQISNELFFGNKYPEGTYFILYCHSGGSSGYVQMQLKPQLPQYNIINMDGGIVMYQLQKNNF